MDSKITPDSDAGQAFAGLRAEISLLRRAVERLTDERTEQPDYAPSLEMLAARLEDVCTWARRVSERPAMKLTPDVMVREIAEAAAKARSEDRAMLKDAVGELAKAQGWIDQLVARKRDAKAQSRDLRHNRIAFALAGVLFSTIVPGAVARSLPVSWALPERIAARMLGADMATAGQQMIDRTSIGGPERRPGEAGR